MIFYICVDIFLYVRQKTSSCFHFCVSRNHFCKLVNVETEIQSQYRGGALRRNSSAWKDAQLFRGGSAGLRDEICGAQEGLLSPEQLCRQLSWQPGRRKQAAREEPAEEQPKSGRP